MRKNGYSLIEVASTLFIFGIIISSFFVFIKYYDSQHSNEDNVASSSNSLNSQLTLYERKSILGAIVAYSLNNNGALPCPVDGGGATLPCGKQGFLPAKILDLPRKYSKISYSSIDQLKFDFKKKLFKIIDSNGFIANDNVHGVQYNYTRLSMDEVHQQKYLNPESKGINYAYVSPRGKLCLNLNDERIKAIDSAPTPYFLLNGRPVFHDEIYYMASCQEYIATKVTAPLILKDSLLVLSKIQDQNIMLQTMNKDEIIADLVSDAGWLSVAYEKGIYRVMRLGVLKLKMVQYSAHLVVVPFFPYRVAEAVNITTGTMNIVSVIFNGVLDAMYAVKNSLKIKTRQDHLITTMDYINTLKNISLDLQNLHDNFYNDFAQNI